MRAFYTDDFKGIWPVGTAAAVVADNEDSARDLLRRAIVEAGLKEPGPDFELKEIEPGTAVVIRDGDY